MGDLLEGISELRLAVARITLVPTEPLALPAVKGVFWRGVLGAALGRMVCAQSAVVHCPPCQLGHACAYGYLFETHAPHGGEAETDMPGPLLIQAPLDYRMLYRPGEPVEVDLILVGQGTRYLPYLVAVFEELQQQGLGRRRTRFVLERVSLRNPFTGAERPIYLREGKAEPYEPEASVRHLLGDVPQWAGNRVALSFLTPTRIKDRGAYIQVPEFHHVVRGLVRRIRSLALVHQQIAWAPDESLSVVAETVQREHTAMRWVGIQRYSARQGRGMSLSGFAGEVVYRGQIRPYQHVLQLGALLQVGKATTFGLGRYVVVATDDQTPP